MVFAFAFSARHACGRIRSLEDGWGRETPKSRTFRRGLARTESRANNSLIDDQSTVPGHSGRFFKAFSAF